MSRSTRLLHATEVAWPRVEALESRTLLAVNLPSGFEETIVHSGLTAPTSMELAPDGRIFVSEKDGKIRIIKNGQLLSQPALTLQVDNFRDRGISAVELDPNFASNKYIYVHYNTYDPAKPNQQNNASKVRLSRFTMSGDSVVAGSELILVNNVPSDTGFHPGGFLDFGTDGKIYVGFGSPDVTQYSQDLQSFAGKVLRINPDGTAPTDNPFYGNPNARGAIWAYGWRNPFSGAVDPVTGKIFINDVGENSYEEVNELKRAKNYGWPNSEGYTSNPAHENPFYAYDHSYHPNNEAAITGGVFFHSNAWPSQYEGKYFFADYDEGTLRYLNPSVSRQATMFGTGLFRAVDLDMAPDGNLYYLSVWGGYIGKISYVGQANRNPNAVASATTPTSGMAPLSVSFTASGSSDPDGDALTYSWNFGDGQTASGQNVTHEFDSNGTYNVVLTVSDGNGGADLADAIVITVGNNAPTGNIVTPTAGSKYQGGQTINFSGTGDDQQDGTLPASAFSWKISFYHGTDAQSFQIIDDVSSGSINVPAQSLTDPNQFYRIELTVTDSDALSHVSYRDILPQTANITLASNVAGLEVNLDNQPRTTPYTFVGVVGLTRNLSAPLSQSLNGVTYAFVNWSDGGSATHNVSSPAADTTYTATYQASTGSHVPGTIQIEDFDDGAQNVAYFDTDTANQGGAYRSTRVDIQATGDTGAGYNVGWTKAGEWLKYSLNVAATGTYNIDFRVASKALGGTFHLEIDGVNVTGPLTVPSTGAWQTYQTITKTGVTLSAGAHTARLVMDSISGTGYVGNFNWMRFTQTGAPTNQPPSVSVTSPAHNSSFPAGSTITFVAAAGDTDGTISKVEFFNGGTKIGEDLEGVYDVDWTNVAAGTYQITARATDDDGAVTVSSPITINVTGGGGGTVVNGLTGEYFDNQDLTNPKFTRIDSTVNFNWGSGSPAASVAPDSFSARWTGQVQPEFSQLYRFYVDANNGVRLWVNDQLIINRWTNSWGEASGTINLTAGQKYAIKLEFYEFDNNASVKLSWSSPSRAKQVIPSTRLFTTDPNGGGGEQTDINWASAASSPVKRFEAPSFALNGKVYVFGGWYWDAAASILRAHQRVDVYDQASNTWSRKADIPVKLTHPGWIVDGDNFYTVGGFVGDDPGVATNDIYRYSISANTWTKMTWELPENIGSGGAGLIGRNLHFFGGSNADRVTDTGSHWSINLDNPNAGWTVRASMPNPRHHFSTAVVNGKIYVFGGQHSHDGASTPLQDNSAHVYDPNTNVWSALPSLPATLSHAEPGTFLMNGKIVMGGGITTQNRTPVNDLLVFDPSDNSYGYLTDLPVGLKAPIVQLVNGKVFLTGGEPTTGGPQQVSYIGTFV